MNLMEEFLVKVTHNSYNLKKGGNGGFDFINDNNLSNTEELKQKKSKKMKEYWNSDRKNQKSKNMKYYYQTNGTEKVSLGLKKRYKNTEFHGQFKKTMEVVNKSIEKRHASGKTLKEKWSTEEYKNQMKKRKTRGSDGSKLKEKWNDPIWREKMLEARKKKHETN